MFTLHHTNWVSTERHLGSNGASMAQRIVSRTLNTIHWLMHWEIWTKSINRLYFGKGVANLRLDIITDTSEEAMCILAYLQDEATLKFTYVMGKCSGVPIRHLEFVSESRYSLNMMSELRKSIIGTTHQQCYSGYSQLRRNNKCLLRTEQRKYWKTHQWINGDTSKVSKTLPTSERYKYPSMASRSSHG